MVLGRGSRECEWVWESEWFSEGDWQWSESGRGSHSRGGSGARLWAFETENWCSISILGCGPSKQKISVLDVEFCVVGVRGSLAGNLFRLNRGYACNHSICKISKPSGRSRGLPLVTYNKIIVRLLFLLSLWQL